jgi:hypothetical protein
VIELAVMIAIGVLLAALGPFGSFALGSFGARLLYWLPAALLGYAIFRPCTLAAAYTARRLNLPELPTLVFGILVAAVPGTFAIAYLGGYRGGAGVRFEELFQLYVHVGLIGVLVTIVFILLGRSQAEETATLPDENSTNPTSLPVARATASAPFLDRLPNAWRDQLVALEMEDHYVRAHGPGVSTLILLRMRDAEGELAGFDGLRVHRSWWVARSAIEQVMRDGRNLKLRLKGGIEAPVARDRIVALKEFGLLH